MGLYWEFFWGGGLVLMGRDGIWVFFGGRILLWFGLKGVRFGGLGCNFLSIFVVVCVSSR